MIRVNAKTNGNDAVLNLHGDGYETFVTMNQKQLLTLARNCLDVLKQLKEEEDLLIADTEIKIVKATKTKKKGIKNAKSSS